MKKCVYLFELDSVRNTDLQIQKAHEVLYEELVTNGNIVVMSLNQVTDSRGFLSILYDPDYYAFVHEQFQAGRLRFSRYKDFRTASQYVQNTISKNLAPSEDHFIYSALPVKSHQKKLLAIMARVLVNADVTELQDYVEMAKQKEPEVLELFPEQIEDKSDLAPVYEEIGRHLETLSRFLEFILFISISKAAFNPAVDFEKYPEYDLVSMIRRVTGFAAPEKEDRLWTEAVRFLQEILKRYDRGEQQSNQNNRSNWYRQLRERAAQPDATEASVLRGLQYAELIVDLCHNYTTERSIHNVSRHYEKIDGQPDEKGSFYTEFFSRLAHEWEDGKEAGKRYLQPESNAYVPYVKSHMNWEQAGRILRRREKAQTRSGVHSAVKIPQYEYQFEKQRREKQGTDIKNSIKALVSTIFYIFAIIGVEVGVSYFEDTVGGSIHIPLPVAKSLLIMMMILVVSALIDKISALPDLVECMKMFKTFVSDLISIIKKRQTTYVNPDNLKTMLFENETPALRVNHPQSEAQKAYVKLWKKRPELFEQSEIIPIVEPNEKGLRTIREYESRTNKKIGVLYRSEYNILAVDLVHKPKDGEEATAYYAYERIIPVHAGAVVIIPRYRGRFLMLRQYRHAIRREQLTFPRGYGEPEISEEENVRKEVAEELGAVVIGEPFYIGKITADSGLSAGEACVYMAEVEHPNIQEGEEGIRQTLLLTEAELTEQIRAGEIEDGYTLAAIELYKWKTE